MWIWLVLAVLAAIGEVLSFDLFLASLAVAAIMTAVLALVLPLVFQLGIFGALSLVGVALKSTIGAIGTHAPREKGIAS